LWAFADGWQGRNPAAEDLEMPQSRKAGRELRYKCVTTARTPPLQVPLMAKSGKGRRSPDME
jgi:hypothetical protein